MSITKDTLQKHLTDPAVFCCRRAKGTVIGADDLEDPTLFDDMVDAGLLTLSDAGLTIEEVLGSTLLQDVEALTPITKDVLDKVNAKSVPAAPAEGTGEKKVIRTLLKKHIKITDVEISDRTAIENGKIFIDGSIVEKAVKEDPLCVSMSLDVIYPDKRHVYTDTIMDVAPIATKVEGELGEGVTKVADGVVFMLTGVDEDGVQIHEFGSSEGFLDEKMYFGHPGCADEGDIIIRCHAVIKRLTGMTRPGPFAAHKCEDYIIQDVRNELKKYDGEVVREEVCEDLRRKGNPRVVLVKEIMG